MRKSKQSQGRTPGQGNRSLFRRTVFLLGIIGIAAFIPLVVQLVRLQLVQHDYWEERAANQQTQDVAVNAGRGTIYDSQGRTLARSGTVYQLILSPRDVLASIKEDNYKDEEGNPDRAAYEKAVQEQRELQRRERAQQQERVQALQPEQEQPQRQCRRCLQARRR